MGCGGSKAEDFVDTSVEDAASKELEANLEREQKEEDAITKLLVLGTGESGKSTVFKQMKILYSVPDPPSKFISVCRANLFGNAQGVEDGMKKLGIAFGGDAGKAASELICACPADGNAEITAELIAAFKTMYEDTGVNEAIERAAEYQLNDSTRYFWERSDVICASDYVPTEQDVLRARVRTTGIVQQNFQIGERKYTMFDVGGQRNERRKWIHCFDNVTAVIFVTAVSEYDQVLFEDENTNRMDEAVTLFDQICNHASFDKTSMILFLNKRDLFAAKLAKKDMTCWRADCPTGHDYDATIDYVTGIFQALNKTPEKRQVYCHATCATDTSNVSFVMDSVFDVILKANLRQMQKADLSKLLDVGGGTGKSGVKTGPGVWNYGAGPKIVLAAAHYTDNLSERKVLVNADNLSELPAVEVGIGTMSPPDFLWLMELGKNVPVLECAKGEVGSFKGNFKEATGKLREVLGIGPEGDLGFLYDQPIVLGEKNPITVILAVNLKPDSSYAGPYGLGFKGSWVVHEDFENPHYKRFCGVDTDANPVKAPAKGEEFDPFAANPVDFRWFKGVGLFTKAVTNIPDKGLYLGVFTVVSTPTGFKIMVNEHNRIMIPTLFVSENQLNDDEQKWMHGVRIRENAGIDLLEGGKKNMGWLGPEMSGEEGATFKEKLDWAVGEQKARFNIDDKDSLGAFYDTEVMAIDEQDNLQLVLYGKLVKNESDALPGHIWVEREMLEIQNMKYYAPKTLTAMLQEQQSIAKQYLALDDGGALNADAVAALRKKRNEFKEQLNTAIERQIPMKWVNRLINWCADKMPSFGDKFTGSPEEIVDKAIKANTATIESAAKRKELIKKYGSL